ncbi:MAG: CsgG/HfaB family protein [Bryobacteraceae bacterium]|nr:CsgG/HfaB family protein [Bryobacteraceae bacterium]
MMVRIACIFLVLAAAPSGLAYDKEIRTMAETMAESILQSGKKTIAVVDFTDLQGNVTELGRFLAEEFSVALARSGRGFEVADRTHLRAILAEHKLASTGLIEPATARRLGQLAGVEVLVTATLTPFGESVRLAVKGLDTATAKVILAAATDIPKTRAIDELLGRGIQSAPGPAAPPPPSAPPAASAVSDQFRNLLVEVASCKRDGSTVACALRLTAQKESGSLKLYSSYFLRGSRALDLEGNPYTVAQLLVGSRNVDNTEIELLARAPLRVVVLVEGVPMNVKAFSVLVLRGDLMARTAGGPFSLELRAVSIAD